MPLFQYPDPQSKIDSVSVVTTLSGSVRAYVHVPETTTPEGYRGLMEALQKHRIMAIPAQYNGKPCLELRDFYKESTLLKLLESEHLVSGAAMRRAMPEDTFTTKELMQNRTLQTAGGLYVLGDLFLGAYGAIDAYKKKQYEDLGAAVGYAAGTQALLNYGKEQTPTRLIDTTREMQKHLYAHGVDVPANSAIQGITRDTDHSLGQKLDRFMRRFPSEVMNLSFSFAGIMMILATRHHNGMYADQFGRIQDRVLGATTLTSGLLGAFVKEKHRDPGTPAKTGLAGVWEWIQESPLRIAGYGLMMSTFIHGVSTFRGYQGEQHLAEALTHIDPVAAKGHQNEALRISTRGVFVITNLMAEFMISLSSKGHGSGIKNSPDFTDDAYSIAADLLLKLPPDQRSAGEEHLANFLCHSDVLSCDKSEIVQQLRQRMHALENNPWAVYAPAIAGKDGAHALPQHETPNTHETLGTAADVAAAENALPKLKGFAAKMAAPQATRAEMVREQQKQAALNPAGIGLN